MTTRRLIATLGVAVTAAAALPAVASAATEVGAVSDGKAPRCPDSCSVITRTTGLPTSVNGNKNVYTVPADGRIVAWSANLGKPSTKDAAALEKQLGRSKAQLSVVRRAKSVAGQTTAAGPAKTLDPYFGGTVTFPLPRTLAVKKGDVIALTVSSWAPVLVQGYGTNTSWRASRPKGKCGGTSASDRQDFYTDTTLATGKSGTFNCLYQSERLGFSATFVPNPTVRNKRTKAAAASSRTVQQYASASVARLLH